MGALFTCLSCLLHPAMAVPSLPALPPRPYQASHLLRQCSTAGRPWAAWLPPLQPLGWVQPAPSSRRGLPGITGPSVTLRPFPMPLVLGARCLPAEGDLWEGRKEGEQGEEEGYPSAPSMEGEALWGSGRGGCFCSSHTIVSPRDPSADPPFSALPSSFGLSLQLREQSSSLSGCMALELGLCQARVRPWWQGSEWPRAASACSWPPKGPKTPQSRVPVSVSIGHQVQTIRGSRSLQWGPGSGSSQPPVLQSITGKVKLLMVTNCNDSQAFHLFSVPPPRVYSCTRVLFLPIEHGEESNLGDTDTVPVPGLGSEAQGALLTKDGSICVLEAAMHAAVAFGCRWPPQSLELEPCRGPARLKHPRSLTIR